jgi:hypothetical protein
VLWSPLDTLLRTAASTPLCGSADALGHSPSRNPAPNRRSVSDNQLGHAAALAGADPLLPVLLLAHQPKQVDGAVAHGVDLQVSGHTHGGQIWPFHYLVRLDQPVVQGLSPAQRADPALHKPRHRFLGTTVACLRAERDHALHGSRRLRSTRSAASMTTSGHSDRAPATASSASPSRSSPPYSAAVNQ